MRHRRKDVQRLRSQWRVETDTTELFQAVWLPRDGHRTVRVVSALLPAGGALAYVVRVQPLALTRSANAIRVEPAKWRVNAEELAAVAYALRLDEAVVTQQADETVMLRFVDRERHAAFRAELEAARRPVSVETRTEGAT